jgi:hypothetical protein
MYDLIQKVIFKSAIKVIFFNSSKNYYLVKSDILFKFLQVCKKK